MFFPARVEYTFDLNFASIKCDLLKWDRRDFSWIGRINILNMNVLPHLLYFFMTIPICLPRSFFASLKKLFTNFIWAQKKPKIARTTLIRPKTDGGLAVPDALSYYVAAVMTSLLMGFIIRMLNCESC